MLRTAIVMIRRPHRREGDDACRRGRRSRARFKYPNHITRINLHQAMLDAAKAASSSSSCPGMVVGFEDGGDRVTGANAGWTQVFRGAALVGAEACALLHSGGELIGDRRAASDRLRSLHRTIVPMSELSADVPRDVVALWRAGFHIVHYPLRHGTLFNIVAVFGPHHSSGATLPIARSSITYCSAHPR